MTEPLFVRAEMRFGGTVTLAWEADGSLWASRMSDAGGWEPFTRRTKPKEARQ